MQMMENYGGLETVVACNVAGAVTLIAVPTPLGIIVGCLFLLAGIAVGNLRLI